jgi:hypothetical protein
VSEHESEHEHLDGLARRINEAYRNLGNAPGDRALMLQVGEFLSEAKTECPDAAWQVWLEENFEGSGEAARDLLALHNMDRLLREALDFISDDGNFTPEGVAARDVLLGDLEAIEQEHRL